jgi:outer membrane protein OmpA-like peptidoglycan-associated protein
MRSILLVCVVLCLNCNAQDDSLTPVAGKKAPSFIMHVQANTIQSITFPHMNKIILVHFWNTTSWYSRMINTHLKRLVKKYRNASYKSAENFEVIAIAVQTDRTGWRQVIEEDSLHVFTNGIAVRGFSDMACKKFSVTSVPASFLIDETGTILAVNPRLIEIENILDERKNFQPIKKDITGILAQSSNRNEVVKFSRLFLFNYYGDSLAKTTTSEKGEFMFSDIKLNQDFLLKVDNKIDITTSDPIALYTPTGEFMLDGRTKDEGFVFNISSRATNKLIKEDTSSQANALGEIDVIKSLTFSADNKALTSRDEAELKSILLRLQKNPVLKLEFITHTDARMAPDEALQLTAKQADAIKTYFIKRGVPATRLKAIAKGNSELRKLCEGTVDCRDEDHRMNRRVEFLVYKD